MIRDFLTHLYLRGRHYLYSASSAVLLSALFLTLSIQFPDSCWWLVFIAYIPLFCAALARSLFFIHGFLWGLLCWTGQLYALFYLVYEHGQGQLRLLGPVVLILYCALHSALLFYIAHRLTIKTNNVMCAGIWVVGMTLYYTYMRSAALWIIGLSTGYPLALPLLPLAVCPPLLGALPSMTSGGLLICLLTIAMASAYYAVTKKHWALVVTMCALIPFCIGFFVGKELSEPDLVSICAIGILPTVHAGVHPRDQAHEINRCITEIIARKPEAQIIILPESSYPWALNKHETAVELWSINALHQGHLLVIGSYYQEGDGYYNGVYGIAKSRIIFNYVKNCRMPFTEYIPLPWSTFTCMHNLFLKNTQGFSSKKSPSIISLTPDHRVCLALCSEFFFGAYDQQSKVPLLVLVNDSWFSCPYIRQLMYLFARYTAIERLRDIMYSSYTYGVYFDKNGRKRIL